MDAFLEEVIECNCKLRVITTEKFSDGHNFYYGSSFYRKTLHTLLYPLHSPAIPLMP